MRRRLRVNFIRQKLSSDNETHILAAVENTQHIIHISTKWSYQAFRFTRRLQFEVQNKQECNRALIENKILVQKCNDSSRPLDSYQKSGNL